MSIKSDKWIRRMSEQHGMIEPFEPGQVKHAADGHRIVSYGTSSYGYDVRCAREFKILPISIPPLSIRKPLTPIVLSMLKPTFALFRPIVLPLHARSNFSAFRAMYSSFV